MKKLSFLIVAAFLISSCGKAPEKTAQAPIVKTPVQAQVEYVNFLCSSKKTTCLATVKGETKGDTYVLFEKNYYKVTKKEEILKEETLYFFTGSLEGNPTDFVLSLVNNKGKTTGLLVATLHMTKNAIEKVVDKNGNLSEKTTPTQVTETRTLFNSEPFEKI